jgi:hypothetical protein
MPGNRLLDFLKQSQALVAALIPFLSERLNLLPFLNPQIAIDLWSVAAALGFFSFLATFNLAQSSRTTLLAKAGARYFGIIILASIISMIGLTTLEPLSPLPRIEDYFIRCLFLTTFVGFGVVLGWMAKILA